MAVNYNRATRWREKESIDLEYVTLESLAETIRAAIKAYDYKAEVRKTGDPYSDYTWYAIFVEEPETDDEMQKRIALEELHFKNKEAADKKLYEALKAKFENK